MCVFKGEGCKRQQKKKNVSGLPTGLNLPQQLAAEGAGSGRERRIQWIKGRVREEGGKTEGNWKADKAKRPAVR